MRITFCPGPGAVIPEWSKGQTEFFGRGDNYYSSIKEKTLNPKITEIVYEKSLIIQVFYFIKHALINQSNKG